MPRRRRTFSEATAFLSFDVDVFIRRDRRHTRASYLCADRSRKRIHVVDTSHATQTYRTTAPTDAGPAFVASTPGAVNTRATSQPSPSTSTDLTRPTSSSPLLPSRSRCNQTRITENKVKTSSKKLSGDCLASSGRLSRQGMSFSFESDS